MLKSFALNRCRLASLSCYREGFWRGLSSRWKPQRDSDIYADRAIREGMRSRAAYKLDEINKRFDLFLRPGANVIDLGAAPGGFSMIASKLIKVDDAINRWDTLMRLNKNRPALEIERTLGGTQINRKYGRLICVDRDEMEPIPGAVFIQGDVRDEATYDGIKRILASNEVDVVLSDMAPDTTGERETNHVRIMELAEEALEVCQRVMRNGGTFVCKVFSGAEEADFRDGLKKQFTKVRAFRPAASRKVSPEMYYVAQGFVPYHLRVRDVSSQPRTHLYEDVSVV